jgi:hypothetical protein
MSNFQKGFLIVALAGLGLSILGYFAVGAFVHAGNAVILFFAPYFLIFGVDDAPRPIPYIAVQAVYYALVGVLVGGIWSTYAGRKRS